MMNILRVILYVNVPYIVTKKHIKDIGTQHAR